MLPSNFLESFEKKQPVYFKDCFTKLITWKELESLINLRPFMSDSRVRILGQESSYTWYASEWSTDRDTFPSSLLETETKKYVFYMRDCSRINKEVNFLCKELEDLTQTPIDMHLYFSLIENPAETKHGFGIHRDKIDVVIVQSEGTSRFKLWDAEDNPDTDSPVINELMDTGSAVYIPAGCWHEVSSQNKRLSLSFAFGNKFGSFEDRHWLSLP